MTKNFLYDFSEEEVSETIHSDISRADELKTAANDDYCSACLGKGKLLCCDSCPRTFHFTCVEDGFAVDEVPPGVWECKNCIGKKKKPFLKLKNPSNQKVGIFDELFYNIDGVNPKVFELTPEVKRSFDNIISHPFTGTFIDLLETDVFGIPITPIRALRQTKQRAKPTSTAISTIIPATNYVNYNEKGIASFSKPVKFGNINLHNHHRGCASSGFPNPQIGPGPDLEENKETSNVPLCFYCGKSGFKPEYLSFLNSSLIPEPNFSVHPSNSSVSVLFQSGTSEMIRCDYCYLYWHLDCLNPPLTSVPIELKESFEIVDITVIRKLRVIAWGEDSVSSLNWDYGEATQKEIKISNSKCQPANTTQLKMDFNDDTVDTHVCENSESTVPGLIQIRRKWKCPCHANCENARNIRKHENLDTHLEVDLENVALAFKNRVENLRSLNKKSLPISQLWHTTGIDNLCNFPTGLVSPLAMLCKVLSVIESESISKTIVEGLSGQIRATDDEIEDWLFSVSKLQSDIAYHIQLRRAINSLIENENNLLDDQI
ncbi:hypothetical protein HK096_006844 [Nowakowskiella sp. JEL0078]|nr:hypothetical protein HK096_006844 [Nowakowskiella sp. JEL0078]